MGIIQQLKETLFGSADDQQYSYQCNVCQATFESNEAHMGKVACEQCGANDVQALPPE